MRKKININFFRLPELLVFIFENNKYQLFTRNRLGEPDEIN